MRAPSGLGTAAKSAHKRAVRAIESLEDADRLTDAVDRYAHAVDVADRARREWAKAHRPLTITHPNGITSAHPLLAVMRDAEKDAARYGEALGLKPGRVQRRGPDPVAAISADIGESPAARLRAVK
jgi:phage terminase small subunit